MKKRSPKERDVAALMNHIQEQLAVLDRKLDSFMTKSLTELSQALAASKPVSQPYVQRTPTAGPIPQHERPSRPMYAVICFDCGQDCEIPFKPSGDRPVYCKECFAKRKAGQRIKVTDQKSNAVSIAQTPQPAATTSSAPSAKEKKKKAAVKKPGAKKKAVAKKKGKKK
jgi:CxxC-x17-CxxC domain-containing protein